jgi:hypothetical protein
LNKGKAFKELILLTILATIDKSRKTLSLDLKRLDICAIRVAWLASETTSCEILKFVLRKSIF